MRPSSRSRRPIAHGLLAGAVGLVVVGAAEMAGGAEGGSTFTVTARADAFSVEVVDASAPVVPGGQVFFASPSSSQATVDSLGASTGFASAPYPGDTAVTVPSAIAALSGLPLPAYPFYATSNYPSVPSASHTSGPFQAESTSSSTDTVARAHVQFTPGDAAATAFTSRATSSASRQPDTGALVAEANTLVEAFSIGPDLAIGTISGRARLSDTPGSEPAKETSFSVGSITLAGRTIGLTDKGFEPLGPIPEAAPLDELQAAGITLKYLPAQETDTRIDSAGLAVSIVRDVPSQGLTGFTIILGRVSVAIDTGAAGALPGGGLSDVQVGIGDSAPGLPEPSGTPGVGDTGVGHSEGGSVLPTPERGNMGKAPQTTADPSGWVTSRSGAETRTMGRNSEQAIGAPAAGPLVGNLGYGPYLALVIGSLLLALFAALYAGGINGVLQRRAPDPVLQLPPRP